MKRVFYNRTPYSVFISHDQATYTRSDPNAYKGVLELVNELVKKFSEDDDADHIEFRVYSSMMLQPGDIAEEKQLEWLRSADIILLLVTSAYLNSTSSMKESHVALERRNLGLATVVPVILTNENWDAAPFAKLLPLRPTRWNEDSAFLFASEIARDIRSSVLDLVSKRMKTSLPTAHNGLGDPAYRRLDFQSLWLYTISFLISTSVGLLIWYSLHPEISRRQTYQGSSPLQFFLDSLIIGIAAMSLLQVFRRLIGMRGAFHRDAVSQWLGEAATSELYRRVGVERIGNMFDLPTELLTGQLSAIGEHALDDSISDRGFSELVVRMSGDTFAPRPSTLNSAIGTPTERDSDAQMGLALSIQRNLDQFQISTSARWRRYLLETSIILSMALFSIGIRLFHAGSFIPGLTSGGRTAEELGNFCILLIGTTLVGLFSGFLGSIARDIVAIIEKLRR